MRIAVVDYPGHAFPIQLCRELARRGHDVLHIYYADFPGPKGPLARRADDPKSLSIAPVTLDAPLQKYNYFRRRQQEINLGKVFGQKVRDFAPDIIVTSQIPIDGMRALRRTVGPTNAAYVYWLQDILSIGMRAILTRKMPGLGHAIAEYYRRQEADLFRKSDAIVAISEDFFSELSSLSLDPRICHVVPNWAPLPEIPLIERNNSWSEQHGLKGKAAILYSGTMGLKHNPELLVRLAKNLRDDPSKVLVVVSEGLGADYLSQAKAEQGLNNLNVLPFQPAEALPYMLASADVLTAFIEPEAGAYSVPSKLLSYFCAGRAVVAGITKNNAAAREINRNGLGLVVEPDDEAGYISAAQKLLDDSTLREAYGARAREHAENTFNIEKIAARFEDIFQQAAAYHAARAS